MTSGPRLVKLYTVKQAASVLTLTPRQVRNLIHSKKLDSVRPGNEWFVTPESVEAYQKIKGRKKRKRTCPMCGGVCRTTGEMRWSRYIWTCQKKGCAARHFVYRRTVKMLKGATCPGQQNK